MMKQEKIKKTAGNVKSYGEEQKQQVKYTFFYYSL